MFAEAALRAAEKMEGNRSSIAGDRVSGACSEHMKRANISVCLPKQHCQRQRHSKAIAAALLAIKSVVHSVSLLQLLLLGLLGPDSFPFSSVLILVTYPVVQVHDVELLVHVPLHPQKYHHHGLREVFI